MNTLDFGKRWYKTRALTSNFNLPWSCGEELRDTLSMLRDRRREVFLEGIRTLSEYEIISANIFVRATLSILLAFENDDMDIRLDQRFFDTRKLRSGKISSTDFKNDLIKIRLYGDALIEVLGCILDSENVRPGLGNSMSMTAKFLGISPKTLALRHGLAHGKFFSTVGELKVALMECLAWLNDYAWAYYEYMSTNWQVLLNQGMKDFSGQNSIWFWNVLSFVSHPNDVIVEMRRCKSRSVCLSILQHYFSTKGRNLMREFNYKFLEYILENSLESSDFFTSSFLEMINMRFVKISDPLDIARIHHFCKICCKYSNKTSSLILSFFYNQTTYGYLASKCERLDLFIHYSIAAGNGDKKNAALFKNRLDKLPEQVTKQNAWEYSPIGTISNSSDYEMYLFLKKRS